jgi:hypothetical protein
MHVSILPAFGMKILAGMAVLDALGITLKRLDGTAGAAEVLLGFNTSTYWPRAPKNQK